MSSFRARSVADFDTPRGLREALRTSEHRHSFSSQSRDFPKALIGSSAAVRKDNDEDSLHSDYSNGNRHNDDGEMDWILTNYHAETSHTQSLSSELQRLQVLKSYLILDSEREARFERITGLAQRMFQVPIALVSLVDLGRQWFMSNRGLHDVRETPRKLAFCAHLVISKEDMLIVPDATKDERFNKNPLVTDAPHIRFYAGAPLMCPEGYRLGTLCLIDTVTHPDGLSLDDKQTLRELSEMVVDAMVERRREKIRLLEDQSHIIATTAHDLLTPLSGVQMSVSLLMEDEDLKSRLNENQKELVQMASCCAEVMNKICHNTMNSFRSDKKVENKFSNERTSGRVAVENNQIDVRAFVENLKMVMEPYPKKVPIFFSVEPNVPNAIIGDDLKIFRSALNFLTNSAKKTVQGSIQMKIYVSRLAKTQKLVFECEDTGPGVELAAYPYLFRPFREEGETTNVQCVKATPDGKLVGGVCQTIMMEHSGLGLYSVAHQINSIGGEYGFRPRGEEGSGAIFWFSIPLVVPDDLNMDRASNHEPKSLAKNGSHPVPVVRVDDPLTRQISHPNLNTVKLMASSSGTLTEKETKEIQQAVTRAVAEEKRKLEETEAPESRVRRALVIDDSQVIRKSVGRALSRLGFQVEVAANGLEGFRQLQANVYDVVLCDYLMPVMDGLDCVQQYRTWEATHRPWISQYIVGISAHASAGDVEKGKKAGMNDFKAKPVTLKVLKELHESDELSEISKKLDEVLKIEGDQDETMDESTRDAKRRKSGGNSEAHEAKKACLIAEDSNSSMTKVVKEMLEARKWKAVVVKDGEDCLRLMKTRNWGAVFVDEDLARLTGPRCIERFRSWENEHRVKRQNSVYLLSAAFVPQLSSDYSTTVSFPTGFDGALGKPILLKDFKRLIEEAEGKISDTADPRDILRR